MEVWLPVPGHHPLEASSLGRVRSLPYESPMPNGGIKVNQLSPTYGVEAKAAKESSYSRRQITFRRKVYKVHQLVCLAFHGPPPTPRHEVLHGDEDAHNNRPGNLSWGTRETEPQCPGLHRLLPVSHRSEQPSRERKNEVNEPEKTPLVNQTEGQEIVAGLQNLIEGKPILTVATALVATLFAAVTQDSLNRESREALTAMLYDLLGSTMAANEISEERLKVILAQRGTKMVVASPVGSVVLDAVEDQEAAG